MKNAYCWILWLFLIAGLAFKSNAQTCLVYENFESPPPAGFGTTSGTATINASGNGVLTINNFSAGTCGAGRTNVSASTNSYYYATSATAPYNPTLASNPAGLVVWYFNMRDGVASQPGGVASGVVPARHGAAVVLASSALPSSLTAGTRYAVVYGDGTNASATNGRLQLVTAADGTPYTLATVITGSAANLAGAGGVFTTAASTNYFSIKVTYDPANSTWSLYARDDGNTAFADPLSPTAYTQIGASVVNSTNTATAMGNIGFLGQVTASSQNMSFDNFYCFNGVGKGDLAANKITLIGQNPGLSTAYTLEGFSGGANTTNAQQFYYVFGNTLGANNITVTAPAGLEVGTSPTGSFSSSLTLTQTGGMVQAKVYARASTTSLGTGNLTHAATGATSKTLVCNEAPLGPITATGVNINAGDAGQPLNVTFTNAGTTITGRWNNYQNLKANPPTANMANSTTTCGFADATAQKNYVAQAFQVSTTGSVCLQTKVYFLS